jgi:predicted nucleic acid-binding protein
VGGVWKPLIRVCSRNGESTNIYSRPAGRNLHLLLATLDHGEATFVELLVEPEALMTFIDEHGGRQHASDQ